MNIWAFLYNILKLGVDKDRIIVLTIAVIIIIWSVRIPPEQILKMPYLIADALSNNFGGLLGWISAVLILIINFVKEWISNKNYKAELKRVSDERTKLQEERSGKNLNGSEND